MVEENGAGAWRLDIDGRCLLASSSGNPHRNGLGDPDHAIEHLTPKGNLTLLVRHIPGAQPRPDQAL
jgi:hypothetical protein